MRDYWLTQVVLSAIFWVYVLVCVGAVTLALWLPKGRVFKIAAALVVLGLASIFPFRGYQEHLKERQAADDFKVRYDTAKALFDERCKTAGEKIYRTVEGVEGVFAMKQRTDDLNYGNQFKMDDPYGYAGTGENYLKLFVRGRPTVPAKIGEEIDPNKVVTYKYVEVVDDAGKLLRYTTPMSKVESERISRNGGGTIPLVKESISTRSARYGITWDDISTRIERENWIAGSSQKVIDLQSSEVIAERIGYMFDRGLGDTSGGRSPWSYARGNACPPLDEKVFYFFDRVIQPQGVNAK